MDADMADQKDEALAPVHPGEILLEDFMKPLGLTAYKLAQRLHVPRTRIERLARGETPVTTDTALRLARAFNTTPDFWLALQARHDLTDPDARAGAKLETIEPIPMAEIA